MRGKLKVQATTTDGILSCGNDFWYISYGLKHAFRCIHVCQSKQIPAHSITCRIFFFVRVMVHLNCCYAGCDGVKFTLHVQHGI
jgi:hypothetical protein